MARAQTLGDPAPANSLRSSASATGSIISRPSLMVLQPVRTMNQSSPSARPWNSPSSRHQRSATAGTPGYARALRPWMASIAGCAAFLQMKR